MFAGVELCKGNPAVSIDYSLLVNASHTFDRSNIIGVLGDEVTRMFSFNFSMCFLLFSFTFNSDDLRFGKDQPVLGNTVFQCFETLGKDFQIVPLPNATNTRGRNENTFFAQ